MKSGDTADRAALGKAIVKRREEVNWTSHHLAVHLRCGWDDERVRFTQELRYGELVAA